MQFHRSSPSFIVGFLAACAALLAAASAAPTSPALDLPPAYERHERWPPPAYYLHSRDQFQIIDLRYQVIRWQLSKPRSSPKFQLLDVTLKIANVMTICKGEGIEGTSIRCDNPDFQFKVSRGGLVNQSSNRWTITVFYNSFPYTYSGKPKRVRGRKTIDIRKKGSIKEVEGMPNQVRDEHSPTLAQKLIYSISTTIICPSSL